ncbi:MAG: phosphate ABC transporter substrate-binding protein [Candidatus Thermoplasmatota archaeon]|nr:phosphate ABC transporter substrate-binding protein [Candidatus Thermoplasmatota archaeon]MBS3790648.1 phosphate ABC transporter substrate-binding protein [Candidatus Thermoplasmatota archaeon]
MEKKKNLLVTAVLAILVVAAVSMTGCIGGDNENNEVTVTGSSTVLPIAQSAAEEFNSQRDDIQVSVSGGGSGYGIEALREGTADIGMASRDMYEEEREGIEDARGEEVVEHTVAKDGLAIVVNEYLYENGIQNLSKQDVVDIYSGGITNWEELGGPNEEIFVVERSETSGTYGSFMDMMGLNETVAEAQGQENADVRRTVMNTDAAIGYLGLGYTGGEAPAVAFNGVEPSIETVQSGDYELVRDLHFYTVGDPGDAAQEYIDFVLSSEGQQIVEEEGFIPVEG